MQKVTFICERPQAYPEILTSKWYYSKKIWWWLPYAWGNSNFFDLIDVDKFKNDLINKNAFLIIDFSHDAPYIDFIEKTYLLNIFLFYKRFGIPQSRLIVLTGTSDSFYFTQSDGFKVTRQYKHMFFNTLWMETQKQFLKHPPQTYDKNIDKHFFVLMRKDSSPRRLLNYFLHLKEVHSRGYVSHHRMTHIIEDTFTDPAIFSRKKNFDREFYEKYAYKKHSIDGFLCPEPDINNYGIHKDYSLNSYLSSKTFCEIVVETGELDRCFITEKTFKAFLTKNIFISLNTQNSLSHLHSLGFKTFSNVIDESYDTIGDIFDRIDAMSEELKQLSSRPLKELSQMYNQCQEIVNFNYNHFLSTDWTFKLHKKIENYINEATFFKS